MKARIWSEKTAAPASLPNTVLGGSQIVRLGVVAVTTAGRAMSGVLCKTGVTTGSGVAVAVGRGVPSPVLIKSHAARNKSSQSSPMVCLNCITEV